MNPYSVSTATASPALLAAHNRGVERARNAYRREQAIRERWCTRCGGDRTSAKAWCRKCDNEKRAGR